MFIHTPTGPLRLLLLPVRSPTPVTALVSENYNLDHVRQSTSVEGYDSADTTFNEALQIDMKGLFGDTVGNVSGTNSRRHALRLLTNDPKDEHQSDQS